MKNKFLTICLIMVFLLSFASSVAILVHLRSNDIEETIDSDEIIESNEIESDDTTVKAEMISFTWDGVEYTVENGTTFAEFIGEGLVIGDYYYIIAAASDNKSYVLYDNTSDYLGIPADGLILDGEAYGYGCRLDFSLIDSDGDPTEYNFVCYNGATWEGWSLTSDYEPEDLGLVDGYVTFAGNNIKLNDKAVYSSDTICSATYDY